jgi:hypothetical protein
MDNYIKLLFEYCTRLISDVVTGKADVREVKVPEFEMETDAKIEEDEFAEVKLRE